MKFFANRETGKTADELDKEIRHVTIEVTRRRGNNLDTEDQEARLANLREARGEIN